MQTKTYIVKVAGVTYENRQETIAKLTDKEPCRLVPESTNQYDPNAIAVHVAVPNNGIQHIGYIPKDKAALIAPALEGEPVMCKIREITGGFETRDGDTASYGVLLEIEVPMNEDAS